MAVSRIEVWDSIHAQHDDEREWYLDATACADFCMELLATTATKRVWHFGCGTSILGVLLAERGCDVANTDASKPAVERMRRRPGTWLVDDAREAADRGPFDLVVDKGTFDSITADSATRADAARRVVGAVHAALAPGGAWACFSTFAPEEKGTRRLLEQSAPWARVDCEPFGPAPFELPDQASSFVYVCRRHSAT